MSAQTRLTVHRARTESTAVLRDAGIDSASLDARILLAHVLGVSQTELLLRDPDPIGEDDLLRFRELVARRVTGVPVAYLVGEREFMGLRFKTRPDVLVPRPDTEPLVEWGLAWLKTHPTANIADVGTGSGAIAISMVYHASADWSGSLVATDVSEQALAIALANADAILTTSRRSQISFLSGSLTDPLDAPVDLLLTNLPYLTPQQISENPDLRHEPILALDGGDDGLDLVRMVIDDLHRVLSPEGAVGFEIDPSQAQEVQSLLAVVLPAHRISTIRDLAGDDRHVIAFIDS